jgi:hypothetical protein
MRAYLDAGPATKWSLIGALLGMYANPAVRSPAELVRPADHQVLFDLELLQTVLENAGFADVCDLSTGAADIHTEGWAPLVAQISLIVSASKPPESAPRQ